MLTEWVIRWAQYTELLFVGSKELMHPGQQGFWFVVEPRIALVPDSFAKSVRLEIRGTIELLGLMCSCMVEGSC